MCLCVSLCVFVSLREQLCTCVSFLCACMGMCVLRKCPSVVVLFIMCVGVVVNRWVSRVGVCMCVPFLDVV